MDRREINLPQRSPREWVPAIKRDKYTRARNRAPCGAIKAAFLNLEIFDGEDTAESAFNGEGYFLKNRGTLCL